MSKLAFIFRHAPYGTANTREGLDALLAATAFCAEEDIAGFFLDDGVLNLQKQQQADVVLQKDTASALKLLDLYPLSEKFVINPIFKPKKTGTHSPHLESPCPSNSLFLNCHYSFHLFRITHS